jgi:hypothetical protein
MTLTLVGFATSGIVAFAGAATLKIFENKRYSYSVEYPNDWFLDDTAGRFQLLSFPPQKAVRAVLLPEGGAVILILVPSQIARSESGQPRTLEEWVGLGAKHDQVTGRRDVEIETSTGFTTAVEVKTLCCSIAPFQEGVDWYFMTGGRYFEATVTYWQGDPEARARVETMKQLVRSLRVIRPVEVPR